MQRSTTKPFAELARLTLPDDTRLSRSRVESAIQRHESRTTPRMALLWAYYRNTMHAGWGGAHAEQRSGRNYTLAQERGLPARVLGAWDKRTLAARVADDRAATRHEVVIENDIAWRIQTMVDFMFGRPITIASGAADPALRATIERVLRSVWESSGGITLLQDIALMGHVYGHVDLLVRANQRPEAQARASFNATNQEPTPRGAPRGESGGDAPILDAATAHVRIELIEPPRGVALLCDSDYRDIDCYIIRTRREAPNTQQPNPIATTLLRWWRPETQPHNNIITTTEVFAGSSRQLYETTPDGATTLIDESPALVTKHPADRPPIVHIQNISQPFEYSGLGEVEPLIPLQDELNTRLSDRAARVTMQSFKKHL